MRDEEERAARERPIRVLLADDDDAFLESLAALVETVPTLRVAGHAHNGLETIELAEELGVDAVLLDLHMPLIDGVTAVSRLRRDHPGLSLVAVTGDDSELLHRAALEAGADMVLAKTSLAQVLPARLTSRLAAH